MTYDTKIDKKTLLVYYDSLINDCFKLLPLFEGKNFVTKEITYPVEEAYNHYQKYLTSFIVEIHGSYKIIDDILLLKLINNLEGMRQIKADEHKKLKQLVFKCIDIINKLKEEVGDDT